ncbi:MULTISPECIES: AAA family ATPase [Streptacidiphilus]|uniref:AAA family ATPase n=1 Tax=Streptacidiphilus cavernicola TaxID=3342716 RepID=A0ABV6UHC1_9ACTN|nr:AAA family ATPase [Streptacidiphilus jeojiense]
MYVSRVQIDGIRGFHGARSVDLALTRPDGTHAGWTVLAGRNGSGKSTLLKALAIALCTPSVAYPLAPDLHAWPTATPSRIRLTMDADPDDIEFLLGGRPGSGRPADGAGHGEIRTECVWVDARSRSGKRPPQPVWNRRLTLRSTGGRGRKPVRVAIADPEWDSLTDGMFVGYGPFRRLARDGGQDAATFATLFDNDAALAEGVAWLVGEHHRSLEGRAGSAEIIDAVLALLGDGLLPDGFRVSRVDSQGLWVERGGREFALQEMSDGYRTAVAMVVNLVWETLGPLHPAEPVVERKDGRVVVPRAGVVLIDEVDAHLHVTWQQRVGDWLRTHFPRIQFIVTTHSPYVCQAADPGGLIRLAAPDEDAAPEVVDDDLYSRVVYGSGDDAVLSELFGLESPYSAVAERARRRIGDLEGRVLNGAASEAELAEYEELSSKLNSSLSARVIEVSARLARR